MIKMEDELEGVFVPALALASDKWPRTIDTFVAAFSNRSPPSNTLVIPYLSRPSDCQFHTHPKEIEPAYWNLPKIRFKI